MSRAPMPRHLYRCDVCGAKDFWGPTWRTYGSIALYDVCPDLVPHICSDACQVVAQQKLDSGEWKLPTLSRGGPNPHVTRGPIGYGKPGQTPTNSPGASPSAVPEREALLRELERRTRPDGDMADRAVNEFLAAALAAAPEMKA